MDGLAAAFRETFAHGWAASGGPMTPRVQEACRVAVALACEHAEDPDVFEVTLKLGSLEGTWAKVYDRREVLYAKHIATVTDKWRPLARALPVSQAVSRFRLSVGLTEAKGDKKDQTARAIAQGVWLMHHATDNPNDPEYIALVQTIADALKDGMAEGEAGAIALAAQEVHVIGIDFDIAFRDAWEALASLGDYMADAKGWLSKILDGAATDVGRLLSRLAEAGATYDEMVSAVQELLTDKEIRAITTLVDMAMGQSFARGALALYAREGIREVDYFTAGDTRVCPVCDTFEKHSPYALVEAPAPSIHPFCVVGSTLVESPSVVRAATVRDYVGDVITVRTASGYELTGTPNHPVATRDGWVPLAELKVGTDVISSTGAQWKLNSVNPDVDNIPSAIKDVAESFPVRFGPMPVAAEDFHGDGAGSKVHVVFTDGLLTDELKSPLVEHVTEMSFGGRDVLANSVFDVEGAIDERFKAALASPDSVVRGTGESLTLFGRRLRHAREHALTAIAGRDSTLEESVSHDVAADAEGFCERLLTLSGEVALDQVVGVDRGSFAGHVYNLDTVDGWYIGNGIVTHNCRCTLVATQPLQALDFTPYLPEGATS